MTHTLTWAQEQRILWIDEMLEIYGFINREHITKKFRVSVPQASADLKLYRSHFPGKMFYNQKSKTHERNRA